MFTYISDKADCTVYVPGYAEDSQVKQTEVNESGKKFTRCAYPDGLVVELEPIADSKVLIRSTRALIQAAGGDFLAT